MIGAGLSVIGIQSREAAVFAAVVFLGGLFLSIYIATKKGEGVWYRVRAVAESIKTSSWRFMMCTEPFDYRTSLQKAKSDFRELLNNILSEHKDLAHDLSGPFSMQEQISTKMIENRSKPLDERKQIYQTERIEDQRGYFARSFCKDEFEKHGLETTFVQGNRSFNLKKGTFRGFHFQCKPHEEIKLVSCSKGAILDIIIDLLNCLIKKRIIYTIL